MQLADRLNEPRLTQWSPWGERINRIELTPLWRRAERIAAERGVVATAYEQAHGRFSRIHQFALAYLFTPSTDIYSCPLAMTDGAARVLLDSGNEELIGQAVPHLLSPRSGGVLDEWAVDDGNHRRLGRGADGNLGAPGRGRGVALVRPQVVHLRRDLADGADARATGRGGGGGTGGWRSSSSKRGTGVAGCATSASTGSKTSSAPASFRPPN